MQLRMIENYRQQIEQEISKCRIKHLHDPNTLKPLPNDLAHLEEERMQVYQHLLRNNEQAKKHRQDYKKNQDKKIQKIMQEYIGMVKIDPTEF